MSKRVCDGDTISVYDADTGQVTERTHFDFLRNKGPKYVRERETWGSNKLCVYRSEVNKELAWIYLTGADNIAVSLLNYDENKEDSNTEYAEQIMTYLIQAPSHYISLSTKLVDDAVYQSKKMKVFQVPDNLPQEYYTTHCTTEQAKSWFHLTDKQIQKNYKFGRIYMVDCWRSYHGLDSDSDAEEAFTTYGATTSSSITNTAGVTFEQAANQSFNEDVKDQDDTNTKDQDSSKDQDDTNTKDKDSS